MKKIFLITYFMLSFLTFSIEKKWAREIKKEINMYQIDTKLYRSQQLKKEDYEILYKYNINTIINLRFFGRNSDIKIFSDKNLNLISKPLKTWNVSTDEIADILYQIEKNSQSGSVLIHCYHGSDRTGLISSMYRIIYQNWTIEDAKKELIYGPYGFHEIWFNIPKMFNEETINEIKIKIEKLKK